MYSTIAGTGLRSASSGSQSRAASLAPSGIGIHALSISRIATGPNSTMFIDLATLWLAEALDPERRRVDRGGAAADQIGHQPAGHRARGHADRAAAEGIDGVPIPPGPPDDRQRIRHPPPQTHPQAQSPVTQS